MPKKYISFLGTGNYKECTYRHGDYKTSKPVRFIQEANLDELFNVDQTFGPDDKIVILLTDKSEELNWVDDGQRDFNTKEVIRQPGLYSSIKGLKLPVEANSVKTPDGNSEDEIMKIFSILYDSIDEGDELYLDITHAFRFMPMLMVVLGNYAKLLKKATVVSITYGNYEGRDKEKNEAPVIDLKQLSVIQDWTLAAGQFINCGNADELTRLAVRGIRPILKESRGSNANAKKLTTGMRMLNKVVENFSFCRGTEIVKASELKTARDNFDNVKDVAIATLEPVFHKITAELSKLGKPGDSLNGICAAKWCCEHGLYQQAATAAQETVITVISDDFKSVEPDEKTRRNAVNYSLRLAQDKKLGAKKLYGSIVKKVSPLADSEQGGNLIQNYLTEGERFRNYMNHFGMAKNAVAPNKLKDGVTRFVRTCEDLCNAYRDLPDVSASSAVSPLFLNISNHPSAGWSENQRAAAGCDIVDIKFPMVDPAADEEAIDGYAADVMSQVQELSKDHCPVTAHVMGEMTLTMKLIEKLKDIGVTCVAATTERHVVDNPDGSRTATFNFVRFRRY